ncbi:MAG: TetR/AcrR family transcriptional regulator [Pseudomonadota bacterium]|nr:TetR/AcrR family transcriptional regulator [Pseudomonadota bacterium]
MRKRPKQKRSQQMVEALIDATAKVIQQQGLDHTTTVRIAELAGVSVGSLYQYFDDKESLIEALMESLAEDLGAGLKRLPVHDGMGVTELVDGAIRFGFAALHSRDGLYLELARNWHRLPTNLLVDVLQQYFLELSRLYFLRRHQDYPIRNLEVRVFVVTNSVLFTMIRYFSQDVSQIREKELADELTRMAASYLVMPPVDEGSA